jgi:hypothetical protein
VLVGSDDLQGLGSFSGISLSVRQFAATQLSKRSSILASCGEKK